MKRPRKLRTILGASLCLLLVVATGPNPAFAHKAKHTPEQLKAFEQAFLEQVKVGDMLFHGDGATQKRLGVTLSNTGMACAMCHPFASDTHPYTLKALETYIYWSNRGSKLDPGRH